MTAPKLSSNVENTSGTFMNCTSLTTMPEITMSEIGGFMFFGCRSIQADLVIPTNVTNIGVLAFYNCNFEKVYYQGSLEQWCRIKFAAEGSNGLYYGATLYINGSTITNLVIPNTITEIEGFTFEYCSTITSVTLHDNITKIRQCAFREVNINNSNIPNSVTYIGSSAFYNCGLTNITLSNALEYLGDYAFSRNKLTSATIPSSTKSLGTEVFDSSENLLQSIYYEGTLTDWLNIRFMAWDIEDAWAYHTVTNEGQLYIDGEILTNMVIPNGVAEIPPAAFRMQTWITSVTIPTTLTSIGDYTFASCDDLTINFEGTETQWNAIYLGSNWNDDTNITINFAK